ncbi:HNH endonuclease [Amaricoccus macauensis]|uniref:HNH endonuclease n=1 Tax=Amaricoccus macauensis TaxID=57001 RepID=UPI003C79A87A
MGTLKNIRRKKMIAQRGRCYYCGLAMWEPNAAAGPGKHRKAGPAPNFLRCTAEHLHPRSEGGRNTVDNIVAACWFCNSRRHQRKRPLSPDAYRLHVQRRMAAGRWLAAVLATRSLSPRA